MAGREGEGGTSHSYTEWKQYNTMILMKKKERKNTYRIQNKLMWHYLCHIQIMELLCLGLGLYFDFHLGGSFISLIHTSIIMCIVYLSSQGSKTKLSPRWGANKCHLRFVVFFLVFFQRRSLQLVYKVCCFTTSKMKCFPWVFYNSPTV